MVKPEWGTKRLCQGCGASFYDMRRNPIICPKCDVRHNPVAASKPPRSRSRARASAPEPKPPLKPEETDTNEAASGDEVDVLAAGGDEVDVIAAGGDDIEVKNDADKAADEAELIEDASELGEDKDDMFEAIDAAEKKDEN